MHKPGRINLRYVVDASRNAAMSRGDLDKAQNVRHVAAVRSPLWPERQDCPMEQMAVNIAILNVYRRKRQAAVGNRLQSILAIRDSRLKR